MQAVVTNVISMWRTQNHSISQLVGVSIYILWHAAQMATIVLTRNNLAKRGWHWKCRTKITAARALTHTHSHAYTHMQMHVCMHRHTHTHTHRHTHTHALAPAHTQRHTHACMHTYTHTQKQPFRFLCKWHALTKNHLSFQTAWLLLIFNAFFHQSLLHSTK